MTKGPKTRLPINWGFSWFPSRDDFTRRLAATTPGRSLRLKTLSSQIELTVLGSVGPLGQKGRRREQRHGRRRSCGRLEARTSSGVLNRRGDYDVRRYILCSVRLGR